jgi:hypothetical protein
VSKASSGARALFADLSLISLNGTLGHCQEKKNWLLFYFQRGISFILPS